MATNNTISTDSGFIGIALLFIAFWGEPDLVDALIKFSW